jgi:hypothetical protein
VKDLIFLGSIVGAYFIGKAVQFVRDARDVMGSTRRTEKDKKK